MNQSLKNKEEQKEVVEGDLIDGEANKRTNTNLVAQIESSYFAGPLPHPDTLGKYEKILPGSANRIIKMAEDQSKHRRGLEKKVVDSNILNERIGMILAFITGLVVICLSFYLILNGKSVAGFITFASTALLYAYNFRQQKQKEKDASRSPKEKELKSS